MNAGPDRRRPTIRGTGRQTPGASMAEGRLLGLYRDRRRGSFATVRCPGASVADRPSGNGCAGYGVCLPRCFDVCPYYFCNRVCSGGSIGHFSRAKSGLWERLLFPLGAVVGMTAYAMSIPAFGGWVERSAVLFFNSVFLFSTGSGLLVRTSRRVFPENAMAHSGGWNSSGYSNDSPGDGHIFRNQPIDASGTEAVFRGGVLDWIFDQHHHCGSMASFRKTYSERGSVGSKITVQTIL